jgi:K+-transporting ATPase ATPase C chain
MLSQLRAALVSVAVLTLVTGGVYPLIVTGIAQAAFSHPANGSLVVRNGVPVGSELIGQSFDAAQYFWGRLSATTDANGKPLPYRGDSSAGSNLGPTNPALADEVKGRLDALRAAEASRTNPLPPPPVDLVTSSGSGLDPDISPAAAYYQVARVARARGLEENRVRDLVTAHVEGRQFGVLGEPRVNVLRLNLALDALR